MNPIIFLMMLHDLIWFIYLTITPLMHTSLVPSLPVSTLLHDMILNQASPAICTFVIRKML